jgi:hypothetical protein
VNIAVHQGSKETLGISLSILLSLDEIKSAKSIGGGFFQDQVNGIQLMNLLFILLSLNTIG